jgi:membrane protein YdbS with pleckstrin-like domain
MADYLLKRETEKNGRKDEISVSHINIRQSISILIIKLITIDIFTAIIIGTLFLTLNVVEIGLSFGLNAPYTSFTLFGILAVIKISVSIYVVIDWINDYYEITPKEIIHRRGVLFTIEQRANFDDVRKIELTQGIFGKIFNCGTIRLYDFRLNKDLEAYLIHNPVRYGKILKELMPDAELIKKVVREKVFREEN